MDDSISPGPDRTDVDLMRMVGQGDLEALGVLFSRHHQRVHALCFRLVGEAATADDLVQESFLRVLRYGKGFDGRSAFTTWLHRLVRNVCMDHMSAGQREAKHRERFVLDANVDRESADDGAASERTDLVRRALYRLPPDKREVLVLSRFQDLRYREIAEICDVTIDTVKTRVHRAMRELRQIYLELEQEA